MSQIYKSSGGGGPVPPTVATSYPTDSGTAVPAANVLNVVTPGGGTQGIKTTGSGNTITITLTDTTYSGTAQTIGATTAVINANVPVPINSASSLIVNIVAIDAGNTVALGGESIALVKNLGGVLTVVGSSDVTRNNDMTLAAWNVGLTTSGANVQVQVTGVAGFTLNWRVNIEVVNAP